MVTRIFKVSVLLLAVFLGLLFLAAGYAHAERKLEGDALVADIIKNYEDAVGASLDGKADYEINRYALAEQKKKWIKDMKIKSIAYDIKCCYEDDGKTCQGGKVVETFDCSGNRLELSTFCLDGTLQKRETDKYDSSGRLTAVDEYSDCNYECFNTRIEYELKGSRKKETRFYADSGKICSKIVTAYDERGNLMQKVYSNDDTTEVMETYKYDHKGRKIDERKSDGYKATFKYNDKDDLVESTEKFTDGFLTKTYKYDARHNPVEVTERAQDGKVLNKKIIKYHADGQILEEEEYGRDGLLENLTMHDAFGRETIWLRYGSDGKAFSKTFYRYDSHGSIISETEFCDGDMLIARRSARITRKYNEKGFEIESISRDTLGKLLHISTVSYEYYIPEDVKHSAKIKKGFKDMTFFNQKDRYKLK